MQKQPEAGLKLDALRTKIMRSNGSSGNRTTELRLLCLLRAAGISGWRRGVGLYGRPDFVFPRARVSVFVDGCFWHGCKCRRRPKANRSFWLEKFRANRARDKRTVARLQKEGWTVIRIWEHDLKKNPESAISRIAALIAN